MCGSSRRSAPSAPVPVRTCTVLAAPPELLALALLLQPTLLSLLSSAMGKHAQLVIGPAGSGKSTFCHLIQEHCDATKRTVHIVNLDPAAEHFSCRSETEHAHAWEPTRRLPRHSKMKDMLSWGGLCIH